MMRLRFIVIFLVMVNSLLATNVDSLLQVIKLERQDTNTVNALIEVTRSLSSNFPDSAQIYAKKALHLSEKLGFRKGLNNATYQMSLIYYFKGNYEDALEYIKINKKDLLDAGVSKRRIASALVVEGNIYKNMGDYAEAIKIYDECLEIAKLHDANHLWVVVSNNKSNIYRRQGKHGEALKIYFEALKICDKYDLKSDKVLVLR